MKKISKFISKVIGTKKGELNFFTKTDVGAESMTSPICEDINGDSKLEIILSNTKGELLVFSEEAELLWKFSAQDEVSEEEEMFLDAERSNSINHSPLVLELFEKGEKQIIFGTERGIVYLLNCKGDLIWKYKTDHPIRGGINLFQLKKGDQKGIIFGCSDKCIYILSSKGKLLRKLRNDSEIESTPIVVDNNIIFGDNKGRVKSLNLRGVANWIYETKDKIITKPILTTLYSQEKALLISGLDNNLHCISLCGESLWKFKTQGALYSEPIVFDINKDSLNEIIFGSADGKIYVIDMRGNYIWGYETDFWVISKPITDDFTKDGALEVIVGSYDNNIYVLNGKGIHILEYIPGVSGIVAQAGYYSDIPSIVPGEIMGDKLFSYSAGGLVIGCAVANNKIIVQTKEGEVLWLKYADGN